MCTVISRVMKSKHRLYRYNLCFLLPHFYFCPSSMPPTQPCLSISFFLNSLFFLFLPHWHWPWLLLPLYVCSLCNTFLSQDLMEIAADLIFCMYCDVHLSETNYRKRNVKGRGLLWPSVVNWMEADLKASLQSTVNKGQDLSELNGCRSTSKRREVVSPDDQVAFLIKTKPLNHYTQTSTSLSSLTKVFK